MDCRLFLNRRKNVKSVCLKCMNIHIDINVQKREPGFENVEWCTKFFTFEGQNWNLMVDRGPSTHWIVLVKCKIQLVSLVPLTDHLQILNPRLFNPTKGISRNICHTFLSFFVTKNIWRPKSNLSMLVYHWPAAPTLGSPTLNQLWYRYTAVLPMATRCRIWASLGDPFQAESAECRVRVTHCRGLTAGSAHQREPAEQLHVFSTFSLIPSFVQTHTHTRACTHNLPHTTLCVSQVSKPDIPEVRR